MASHSPTSKAPPNERYLAIVAARLNHSAGGAAVSALRQMTYMGLTCSAVMMGEAAKELASMNPPSKEALATHKIEELAHTLAADSAKAAMDGASIIYAHAILDATIYRLCQALAKFDAPLWLPFIQERKVTFRDLGSTATNELQRKALQVYLDQLERESLLEKCDLLLKVLKPKTVRRVLTGFNFSRERLAELDQLRHDMVHKLKFHRKCRQTDAKLTYLFSTGTFFINLIASHWGLNDEIKRHTKQRKMADQLGREYAESSSQKLRETLLDGVHL